MKLKLEQVTAKHPQARAGAAAALADVSLTVQAGEQVAIIGPSGSGKTTLLYTLSSSLPPAIGNCSLNDINPWELPRSALQNLRGHLFLAPQVPPLPPRQRVVTAVLAGSLPAMSVWRSLRSLFYPADIAGAHAALTRFDLQDKLFDRVDRLSGGERQRVGLARALVSPASLWLIDEPLSALDPTRATQALDTLTAAATERKLTLIMTLHQVKEALERFPRIIGLRDGRVAFDLPTEQVTREVLEKLYAQHEDELDVQESHLSNPDIPQAQLQPKPVVMHCR